MITETYEYLLYYNYVTPIYSQLDYVLKSGPMCNYLYVG